MFPSKNFLNDALNLFPLGAVKDYSGDGIKVSSTALDILVKTKF